MSFLFFECGEFVERINDAINTNTREAFSFVLFGDVLKFAFFTLDDGGEEHKLGAEREFHDFVYDVLDGAARDFAMANWAVRNADASEKKTKVIIDFRDGGDG